MDKIEAEIIRLTAERGPDKSICPSEVAKALEEDWRKWLKPVRDAAIRLAKTGEIEVLRKGKKVEDFDAVKGVIRLRKTP